MDWGLRVGAHVRDGLVHGFLLLDLGDVGAPLSSPHGGGVCTWVILTAESLAFLLKKTALLTFI